MFQPTSCTLHRNAVSTICRFFLTCLFITCVGVVSQVVAQAQTVLQNAAHDLTTKLHQDPDVQKISGQQIVITQFNNITSSGDAAPQLLQSMLTAEFIQVKRFKVVERSQLDKALEELKFGMSDLADTGKAQQIGKLVGASYILLGDMGQVDNNSTYISARLVSIETGESVAASMTTIKMDAGSPPAAANTTPDETTMATDGSINDAAPTGTTLSLPKTVNLSVKAASDNAGIWEEKRPNLGLLGSSDFKIDWRENLGSEPVVSFACGDLKGNGINHLFLVKRGKDGMGEVEVLRWENGKFKSLWNDARRAIPGGVPGADIALISSSSQPALIVDVKARCVWKWDGTAFEPTTNNTNGEITDVLPGPDSKVVAVGVGSEQGNYFGLAGLATVDRQTGAVDTQNSLKIHLSGTGIFASANYWATAGDYDGDGKAEIAVAEQTPVGGMLKPIQVFSQDGMRKGITEEGYSSRVTSWRPTYASHPFIIARRNLFDVDSKPAGGYCFFIRWSGETYEEFWKSIQIDKIILDFHVGDPKGQGQDGLVVLSTDLKNYYLTKIVVAR